MKDYTCYLQPYIYDKIVDGSLNQIILVNKLAVANYKVGNQLFLANDQNKQDITSVYITNLYYFETVMDALVMLDNKGLGFSKKMPLTKIEDKILSVIKAEDVEQYGVVVIEFNKQ